MSSLDIQLVNEEEVITVVGTVDEGKELIPIEKNPDVTKALANVDTSKASQIEAVFTPMIAKIKDYEERFNVIKNIENITDELAEEAKVLQKEMQADRLAVEVDRKTLKAEYVLGGKAVDGVSNIYKLGMGTMEEELKKIVKYKEEAKKQAQDKLKNDRLEILAEYGVDGSDLNLDVMPDEVWSTFVEKKKKDYEDLAEAEIEAQKRREEGEAKTKLETERKNKVIKLVSFIDNFDDISFSDITEEEFSIIIDTATVKKEAEEKRVSDLEAEAEKTRLEKVALDAKEAKLTTRKNRVFEIGLIFNGESYVYEDIEIKNEDLLNLSDDFFNLLFKETVEKKKANVQKKADEEKVEKARLAKIQDDKKEADRIKNLGINRKSKLLDIEVKLDLESCTEMSNEEWTTFYTKRKNAYDEKVRIANEAKEKELQAQKDKEEGDKKALLAPDKTKIEALMAHFDPLRGNLSTQEARDAVTKAYMVLKEVVAGMNN